MKTKVLAILLCSAVSVCGFTGCSNEETDADASVTETEHSNDEEKNKLNTTLHLSGNDITLPCAFSELGDITLDTSMLIPADENDVYGAIYKDEKRIGRVMLKDYEDDQNISGKIVTYIELNPDMGFEELDFSYNGFSFNSSKDQILEAFGTPDKEYNNNVCYDLGNDNYVEFEFVNEFKEIESIKIKADK